MREIRSEIVVPASAERVWAVLADLSAYPRWNPFIIEASGTLEEGQRLRVRIKAPGRRPVRFSPTVIDVQPGRLLAWRGRLVVPGLFDGTHRFEVTPGPTDDSCTFVQSEAITGVLVGFLTKLLRDTEAGFELMNRAMLARVTRT